MRAALMTSARRNTNVSRQCVVMIAVICALSTCSTPSVRSHNFIESMGAPIPANAPGIDYAPSEFMAAPVPVNAIRIEYALIADTLFTRAVTGGHISTSRTVVDTIQLFQTIRNAAEKLQRQTTEAEVRPLLSALYDCLLHPLAQELGTSGAQLEILAEGQLASVPFAALHNSRLGRYLVQDHPLRYVALRTPTVSSAVHQRVMSQLAADSVTEALDYLDQTRTRLASGAVTDAPPATRISAPPGESGVAYALVADTLLIWTTTKYGVEVFRTVVDTIRLFQVAEQAETELERRSPDASVRPLLSALYDWLLRPVELRLGDAGTPIVFVLDQRLAFVPFPALYDTVRGRYFNENRAIRFAVSLDVAKQRATVEPAPGVLLVADPAFDQREYARLHRLHYAREEVRSFAGRYPGAALLEGSRATRPALDSAITLAGVTHFAGHAVFDEIQPERSYLVLAAQGGAPGRITAGELARLDLRHVRLVVLAACRTARSAPNWTGQPTGLSDALLAAGVGGVIGSTWDVDDRFTAALMTEFHRRYQRSHDGSRALREAQLALLRSPDSALRSPAAWAGFRYTGR